MLLITWSSHSAAVSRFPSKTRDKKILGYRLFPFQYTHIFIKFCLPISEEDSGKKDDTRKFSTVRLVHDSVEINDQKAIEVEATTTRKM